MSAPKIEHDQKVTASVAQGSQPGSPDVGLNQHVGATYGDALIHLTDFARTDPRDFLLTVPLTLVIACYATGVGLRVFAINPISGLARQFSTKRNQVQQDVAAAPPISSRPQV